MTSDDKSANPLPGGLVVVATPIGNAADVGGRALDVLARADLIACEDTRVTAKLLARHGIRATTTAYHEHNADKVRPKLLASMAGGATVALVSDAGTPLVSDPGYRLVRDCIAAGIAVTAVPGASSVMNALVLSGLPSDRFLFLGFLPQKSAARRGALDEIAAVRATLVVLESPKRLAASLSDMAAVLGAREAAVAREMTKMFEEVRRGSLADLAAHYAAAGPPKGEVVVVVGAGGADGPAIDDDAIDAMIDEALAAGSSVRDAADRVAATTGRPRRAVYGRALDRAKARP